MRKHILIGREEVAHGEEVEMNCEIIDIVRLREFSGSFVSVRMEVG